MAYRILLVDDSQTTRAIISKVIRLSGVEVAELLEAGNGEEALKILSETWVDVIFTDLNMPVMNGLEFLKKLTLDDILKTVPVVVVTTEGSTQRIEELKKLGIAHYLRKPFTPENLLKIINELLGGKN